MHTAQPSEKPKAHDILQSLVNVFGKRIHFEALDHMKEHMAKVIKQNMKLSTQNKRMRKALEEIRDENIKAFNNGCAEYKPQIYVRQMADLATAALHEVSDDNLWNEDRVSKENTEETQTRAQEGEQQA